MSFKDILTKHSRPRAGYKTRITIALDELEDHLSKGILTHDLLTRQQVTIQKWLDNINKINSDIDSTADKQEIDIDDEARIKDITAEVKYTSSIEHRLSHLFSKVDQPNIESTTSKSSDSNVELLASAISKLKSEPLRPKLNCQIFSGATSNKLEFKNFLAQFVNCVEAGADLSDSVKLSCLRSFLSGYAYRLISHLSITDENYGIALKLLKDEFLDVEFIVDDCFKTIVNSSPNYDPALHSVRMYLNETRAMLYELKSYDVDFLQEDSAGGKLVGHLIFHKLPSVVKRELVHKLNSNYPSINDIFEHYNDALKTIVRTSYKRDSDSKFKEPSFKKRDNSKSISDDNRSTLDNFLTENDQTSESIVKYCKFCSIEGHSMFNCEKYSTFEDRQRRCKELKMCTLCSSIKHTSDKCLGRSNKLTFKCFLCKSNNHISALCSKYETKNSNKNKNVATNMCFTTKQSEQKYILPVVDISLSRGKQEVKARCLLDTGSQRSYFSHSSVSSLVLDQDNLTPVKYNINTFLGTQEKCLNEITLQVEVEPQRKLILPVLVDNDFSVSFKVDQFDTVISNIKNEGFKLAVDFESKDEIAIQGLIGIDILQFMQPLTKTKCLNGSAFSFRNGIVPFGNSHHFLYPSQIIPISQTICEQQSDHSYQSIVSQCEDCFPTQVNFVLNPKQSYFDPLDQLFDESNVERNVDKMFSCESLGLSSEQESVSDYDASKIQEFRESIEYKDNCYYVKLPWHEDKIKQVPSNHEVALSVLNKVVKKLENQKLLNEYIDVFKQQEAEGIIEKINVDPENFKDYIWIPHRPIIKTEQQNTFKIRPVFNCSLKTKGAPSLNEATYPGINLMGDMLELLFHFRSNKYIMLSDIRKAFLMIKLADEVDSNRFCFFLKEGDKLTCYRYKTILFGCNASPFILNFVIKHHAKTFPEDQCTKMLKNNFYVDNLIYTNNSPENLFQLYKIAESRMKEGGFVLRSWNTNCDNLKQQMIEDKNLVEHGCDTEKVLGYKYSPEKDSLHISAYVHQENIKTKRTILSQVSKIFDPLGLCTPVTVRGKILLRELWSQNLGWDETIPDKLLRVWDTLSHDLELLGTLSFPRNAIQDNVEAELCLFCDASKQAYGFTAFSIQNGSSSLLFSKTKVSPMKTKTLPTLELLSVFLAVKCLPTLLDSYPLVQFRQITLAVDAQIVLSWLLTEEIKTKNLFARNRILDIHKMISEITQKYDISINFKYVKTEENVSDMITRGITTDKFEKDLNFWLSGPSWLKSVPIQWPRSDLNCLSEENKVIVQTTVLSPESSNQKQPLIPFDKYSDLNKLIRVISYVFKFISKTRKLPRDYKKDAKKYLFKEMQSQTFPEELTYLKNVQNNNQSIKPTTLVKNLDLFLDEEGLIRAKGRIRKNVICDTEVIHPILLGKKHDLTNLIIFDCHSRCKHLGIQTTLNKLRMIGFWIPKGRQNVKSVLSKCVTCQKINNLSFKYPKVTNLPKHRVNLVKPYLHTGVDYTGHMWVDIEGRTTKMYLLLFTCLSIRAVHIELVPNMSTHSFILAFLRFSNQYGIPSHIYSDNAKSFIAGCSLIEEVFASSEFSKHFEIYNIKHIKIPLYSAWVGSTWERLIRVVKSCIYKCIGRSKIKYFELVALLSDIQNSINSRPLTYRCTDSDLEIITPNCFLTPNKNPNLYLRLEEENITQTEPPSRDKLIKTLESRDKILSHFKKLWVESYLLSLREQCTNLHEVGFEGRVKENDVVLIKHPSKPRPFWQLGRVIELFPGDDGKVRSVKLQKGDGNTQLHSLKHLYPLELSLTHAHFPNKAVPDQPEENKLSTKNTTPLRRSKRDKTKKTDDQFFYYKF